MSNSSNGAGGGIGFFGLLTILFIALKLLGAINWPWLWVLVPLWGPFAIAIVIILVIATGAGIAAVLKNK